MVTADLYPSIPHEADLYTPREALDNRENQQIPTDNLLKKLKFVLEKNYFEFNDEIKKQLLGAAIGTKLRVFS